MGVKKPTDPNHLYTNFQRDIQVGPLKKGSNSYQVGHYFLFHQTIPGRI